MLNKKRTRRSTTHPGFWQSYSDMMAALLLMFILIMAFTLAQSLKSYEEKVQIQNEQQARIESLVGIKADIILALNDAFKDSDLSVDIDEQTGAISLDSSVLFAYNSAELSDEGKQFLKDFLPLYISVLLDDDFAPYVAEIIIEGHTDTNGEYIYNLNLSQERAFSVAEFCLNEGNGFLTDTQVVQLRPMMTANGRSFSNPVFDESGKVDADKSRRVEIKFRMKDDEMIEQLKEILDGI